MAIKEPLDDPRRRSRKRASAATSADEVVVVDETVLLKGFDTLLKSFGAVVHEMREASSDVRTTMDMVVRAKSDAAVLRGGIGGVVPESAQGDPAADVERARRVRQATDDNWKRMERDARGRFVRREAPEPEPEVDANKQRLAEAAEQREESRASHESGVRRRHPRISPVSAGARAPLGTPIEVGGGWRDIQNQTRSSIRERVYQAAAQRAEAYAGDDGLMSDVESGHVMRLSPGYTVDPATGQFLNEAGEAVSAQEATRDLGSQSRWARRALASQTGMRALNSWRTGNTSIGRSLASALPQSALRVAGYGAVALGAANQVWESIQSQAAQNREFQEIYGGSNTDQIGERMSQWWNRNVRGRFSLLGGGNYDALFRQAMQLGLRGDDRGEYINEGARLMGQGVNQQQTAQILGVATQTGQSLDFLSQAIGRVNDAAREAGVNAAKARDIFIRNYEMSSEMLYGSPQAKNLATVLTEGQLQMARMYQGIDLTGQFTGSERGRFLAARQGMSYTDYLSEVQQNPLLAVTMGEDETREQLNMMQNERLDGRTIEDVVDEYLEANPNYRPEFDQADLGRALVEAGFAPDMIQMYLAANGINVSEDQAPGVAGHLFTNRSPGALAVEEIRQLMDEYAPGQAGNQEWLDQQDWANVNNINADAGGHYIDYLNENVDEEGNFVRNPIVEQFISQSDQLGVDPGDINDTKLLVDTAWGRMVVPLDWAIRNVPDQIPHARLVEGVDEEYQNMTVTQALGLPQEVADQYDVTSDNIQLWPTDLPEGVQPLSEWEREQEEERAERGETQVATVTFDLTPLARSLLAPVSGVDPYSTGVPDNSQHIVDFTTPGG